MDEIVKNEKRNINKAQRDLDREAARLEQEEQKLKAEIYSLVAKGQNDHAKLMAKQLVKNREQQRRLMMTKCNIGGVGTNMTLAVSQAKTGHVIGSANQAMMAMNQTVDAQQVMKNIQQYEMQSEKMGMTQEMMDDALDGGMNAELDVESEDILAQVLDDAALDRGNKANPVPQSKIAPGQESAIADDALDAEVEQMLRKLKGSV
eukprot:CAMPEP_0184698682 /NCGR_PEP_ID=MMETSP0313-20130426/5211_1 /TAXON_ID=2792 /ORGANISM="Porphyridium aerugineum, Strain SAG 1380-2" /LENGTH=204 /DNA_ID=CAMNT_0027157653 /DNA_START=218 /DNA_END=832 /DNA_ORIENTATION=+